MESKEACCENGTCKFDLSKIKLDMTVREVIKMFRCDPIKVEQKIKDCCTK